MKKLRNIMEERGVGYAALARLVGSSPNDNGLRRMVIGSRKASYMTVADLAAFAKILDVDLIDLIDENLLDGSVCYADNVAKLANKISKRVGERSEFPVHWRSRNQQIKDLIRDKWRSGSELEPGVVRPENDEGIILVFSDDENNGILRGIRKVYDDHGKHSFSVMYSCKFCNESEKESVEFTTAFAKAGKDEGMYTREIYDIEEKKLTSEEYFDGMSALLKGCGAFGK